MAVRDHGPWARGASSPTAIHLRAVCAPTYAQMMTVRVDDSVGGCMGRSKNIGSWEDSCWNPFCRSMGSGESNSSYQVYVANTFTHQAILLPPPTSLSPSYSLPSPSAWWFCRIPGLSPINHFLVAQVAASVSVSAICSDSVQWACGIKIGIKLL